MKIKEIDQETKNTKKKNLLPIAKAALGLGLTATLIKTGIIDYDAMINWENMSETINNMNLVSLPGVMNINTIYDLVKVGITTFGMNTLMIADKGLNLTKEVLKPIVESDKVQNNPTILKIKEVLKGKNKDDEPKKPKALVNLAKSGLALGFKAYMIASGQIDYNSVYDLTKLPHKFVKIAQVAENIDLNKLKLGVDSLKILPQFISERRQEKQDGMPLVPRITFRDILGKISKGFPTTTRITDLDMVHTMAPNGPVAQIEPNPKELEDR